MPAPELLDVEPLDDKEATRKGATRSGVDQERNDRLRVGIADEDEAPRAKNNARSRRDAAPYDDDEDDSLFDAPPAKSKRRGSDDRDDDSRSRNKRYDGRRDRYDEEESAPKGWRKGRQFIVEEDDEDTERRPFFARRRKNKNDGAGRDARDESLRFTDEEDDEYSAETGRLDDSERDYSEAEDIIDVVDADWEDVADEGDERQRGFGRRIRAERRRATALARMEDVRPLDPDAFDEEFFAALRVTPRELERAIRKARRRAEAREKNRLTPLRVLGWTAWLAVVVGAFYAVVVYRDDIVKVAPKAADAYAVIGIEANPYGLSIENVRHRLAMSTGGPMIEITGNLRNESDGSVIAPLLQAEALGPRGELLARWTFAASETDIAEGGAVDFMTRMPAPEGVSEVALSFAPSKSVLDSLLSSED